MTDLVRRIDLRHLEESPRESLRREWLLTNGLGGYASGTISGSVSRRYHGLLIAALPAPLGRVVMFNHLAEHVCTASRGLVQFGGEEPGAEKHAAEEFGHYTTEFRLESQLPVWRYEVHGLVLEKRVLLLHGQNTVHIRYELISGAEEVHLELRPSVHFREHEHHVADALEDDYEILIRGSRYEIRGGEKFPSLRLTLDGEEATLTHDGGCTRELDYAVEEERGYQSRGVLWSPGFFAVKLRRGQPATLIASTEPWPTVLALRPEEAARSELARRARLLDLAHPDARTGPSAELVLAADQFIMTPAGRVEDAARARAAGDEVRSVIAGYHWFTDWGRDTMISLEGLTLTTGRYAEAGWILRTFSHYVRDGLIPNMFPEGESEGLYHTADATLWFFHAVHRYLEATNDRATLQLIFPKLREIIDAHLQGTRFGIGVDPSDGLLRQGAEGYQLTWMDAKVDGWVVTPRRGKAVELNALWYNALRLFETWTREMKGEEAATIIAGHAQRNRESFNRRFWSEKLGYLYDVVDGAGGDDHACRPNQLFAIALDHPVLEEPRWASVLQTAKERLLTPVGLRSLSGEHPDYKARYFGDLRTRDAAYHQGTVWGWLTGPFVDVWLKVYPDDKAGARKVVEAALPHLDQACVGSISEIFDAEAPFTPRGCVAQAWSVAEVLRSWVKTAP